MTFNYLVWYTLTLKVHSAQWDKQVRRTWWTVTDPRSWVSTSSLRQCPCRKTGIWGIQPMQGFSSGKELPYSFQRSGPSHCLLIPLERHCFKVFGHVTGRKATGYLLWHTGSLRRALMVCLSSPTNSMLSSWLKSPWSFRFSLISSSVNNQALIHGPSYGFAM